MPDKSDEIFRYKVLVGDENFVRRKIISDRDGNFVQESLHI